MEKWFYGILITVLVIFDCSFIYVIKSIDEQAQSIGVENLRKEAKNDR